MATVGLFFGSDEGNTEFVAEKIRQELTSLGITVIVHDIADVTQLEIMGYDQLIFGISTWDFGQIQSDWDEFWDDLETIDFTDKTVALYGLGDQFGYSEYFLDAMGMLHDVIVKSDATVIGHWSAEGYEFDLSKAWNESTNQFVGLAIDEDHQEDQTDDRVKRWCQQISQVFLAE